MIKTSFCVLSYAYFHSWNVYRPLKIRAWYKLFIYMDFLMFNRFSELGHLLTGHPTNFKHVISLWVRVVEVANSTNGKNSKPFLGRKGNNQLLWEFLTSRGIIYCSRERRAHLEYNSERIMLFGLQRQLSPLCFYLQPRFIWLARIYLSEHVCSCLRGRQGEFAVQQY